jgi:GntR family transcriptional regulator
MQIHISNSGDEPIYEQIVRQIEEQIISGGLCEGDALPSMRLLAKELRISVITTKRAYEELERNGFIVTMQGRGSFVATKNMELVREQQLKKIEEHISEAIKCARICGLSSDDLKEMIAVLYEEEKK